MVSSSAGGLRPVVIWLITGCVLIACMVVLGGITRLTGSGLSITEWKPIMGALPPMNEGEWNEAFTKYKAIPQYALVNQHMDLAGFKRIFFWEYLHRNWGRLMGIAFIVPFLTYWRKGLLHGWLLRRSIAILIGGGLVGGLGWFMVASGLEDNPDVSHFRLAIHLCAALTVFGMVFWTINDIIDQRSSFRADGSAVGKWARWILVLLTVQIIWGAFTAGLDAGRIYNTWPLMNGAFMPDNVRVHGSFWQDFADHRDGVQFVHRNLAWLVAAAVVGFAVRYRSVNAMRGVWAWLIVAVLLQFVLGVFTILTQVRIELGVLHQFGALVLLSVLLKALHRTGRSLPNEA